MEYDNTNSGAFFKNDQKATANHPDYKGSVNVNGVDYWISGWIKPTKADPSKRFMSLSVQPKQPQTSQRQAPQRPAQRQEAPRQAPQRMTYGDASDKSQGTAFDGMDSDIPF